jgi:hypothetical protein
MNPTPTAAGVLLVVSALCGCTVLPSTGKRAIVTGLGAVAGGGAGYTLGDKKPGWTVAGAGLGALATGAALGADPAVQERAFDDGYVQGQADAIKRQYFLRQALEATPVDADPELGSPVHYVVPGPTVTADGRKLEPHTVTLSVTE